MKTEQFHQGCLAMAYRIPSPSQPDFFALTVLCTILGDGMSSRLFQKIREERGLGYRVSSSIEPNRCFSILSINIEDIVPPAERTQEAYRAVCKELAALRRDGVNEFELGCAKNKLCFQLVEHESSPMSRCALLVSRKLWGLNYGGKDIPGLIREVSLEDVHRAAKLYLRANNAVAALLLPVNST